MPNELPRLGLLKTRLRELNAGSETVASIAARSTTANAVATSTPVSPPANSDAKLSPAKESFDAYLTPPPSDESTSNSIVDGSDSSDNVYSFTFVDMEKSEDSSTDDTTPIDPENENESSSSLPKLRRRGHPTSSASTGQYPSMSINHVARLLTSFSFSSQLFPPESK